MSAGRWDEIKYPEVPSRAMMIYRKAFEKHDADRYNAFIKKYEKRGKKPLTEVVESCGISRRTAYRYLEFYKESK